MDRVQRLLAECVAQPDADEPRAVWADEVGGERAELVMIQCGREQLPKSELVWRNRRERELLQHAMAWSGLEGIARRVQFRRGFVDAIEIDADVFIARSAEVLAAAPLVSSLSIANLHSPTRDGEGEARDRLVRIVALPAFEQIRGLDLVDRMVSHEYFWSDIAVGILLQAGVLAQLRAFGANSRMTPAGLRALANATELERLWLRDSHANADALHRIAATAPRLHELDLDVSQLDFTALAMPKLTSLILRNVYPTALARLSEGPMARQIEHLVVHGDADTLHFGLGPALPRLRSLELRGSMSTALVDKVLVAGRFPELRELRVGWTERPAGLATELTGFAPQLDLLDLRDANRLDLPPLDDVDLLVDERHEPRLLDVGRRPRADWRTIAIEYPGAPTAAGWLVCVDGGAPGRVWDVGSRGEADVRIGRGRRLDITLPSSSVARTHAIIRWIDGAWMIRDLRSTNGTLVDGKRTDRALLTDGAELRFGAITTRFFTSGARASACARRVVTHEPISDFPRATRPEAAWLNITNLVEVEARYGVIVANEIIRTVARRLRDHGEGVELSSQTRASFRVYPREKAPDLAALVEHPVENEGLMHEVRIATRPFG